jgi:class 3 adenylate cyclase
MSGTSSSLGHELRTPLNAIIGYSAMLLEDLAGEDRDGAPKPELDSFLERIHHAGELLLARLDSAVTNWQVGSHELRTLLGVVLGYAEMILESSGLDASVSGDVSRIEDAGYTLLVLIERLDRNNGVSVHQPLPREAAQPANGEEQGPRQGASLLVVDDNPMNRDILTRRLRRLGHHVTQAENGRQALAILRAGSFDLVLLDIVMPEVDGYAVLEQVRSDETLRHLPVLVLSALDESDAVARCLQMGAVDYLPKPFDPIVLRARVAACLENKRLHDREVRHLDQVEFERRRADELLQVLLPPAIAAELKATKAIIPRRHEDVAVLFSDVAGFTRYCDARPPEEVLANLQDLVERFERIAMRHGLQKIKTIGDAFLAVAGAPDPVADPALAATLCGLEMVSAARELPDVDWQVRVGIHCGPVVAGVLGRQQYGYDVWGDTVNTAARVEQHGVVGGVTLSGTTWARVADHFTAESLGVVAPKGKDSLDIYRIIGRR